jgi:hypothetical protein
MLDAGHCPTSESDVIRAAFGFWEAKIILSAITLKVFDALASAPADAETLSRRAGMHPRGARDFLDALVSMGLLDRNGELYSNSGSASTYLTSTAPAYLGWLFELAETRLYPVWGKLTEALKSGQPQNEAQIEPEYYPNLMANSDRLGVFVRAMTALSMESARHIAQALPWNQYCSAVDLGGAEGALSIELVKVHPHLAAICFDLPEVEKFFRERVEQSLVRGRISFCAGDFFRDALPRADVFIMGHILHNWSPEQRMFLVKKTHDVLPQHGSLVVYDAMIDDERRANIFGLLMSLNMLLVTSDGSTYTISECRQWLEQAGFRAIRTLPLTATDSAVIGVK